MRAPGAAIAYGLAGYDKRVLMLDGADTDYRAAKANFGLVWPKERVTATSEYHRLSAAAADAWPEFAAGLEAETGISLDYQTGAGLKFCLSDDELSARAKMLDAWAAETPELAPSVRILDRSELGASLPPPYDPALTSWARAWGSRTVRRTRFDSWLHSKPPSSAGAAWCATGTL